MCLFSQLIVNPKYQKNQKNGGNPPPLTDKRVQYVPIGCGRCIECRKQKARDWQVRLMEDIKHHKNGKFITLTLSNESYAELNNQIEHLKGYERDNAIATLALRRFLERWRKQYKKSLRHWLVTEIGHNGTENIHLHGIIWTSQPIAMVETKWQYGYIWKGKMMYGQLVNYVNEQTVSYITKYVNKADEIHTEYQAKVLASPGIGKHYTLGYNAQQNKYRGTATVETYRTRTGHKISMPIYWRNKIYSDQEREKLWLQKLDKEIRWVCGEKVSVKNGYEQYDKLIQYHRMRQQRLGYQSGERDMERIKYEQARRTIMQLTRIEKAKFNRQHHE